MSKVSTSSTKAEQPVKVMYRGTVRRFSVATYEELREQLQTLLELEDTALVITYNDEEGDEVHLSSPEEYEEALKASGKAIRIQVKSPKSSKSRKAPAAAAAWDEPDWEGGCAWAEGPFHGKGWGFDNWCGKGKGWHAEAWGKGKGGYKGKGCHMWGCDDADYDTMLAFDDLDMEEINDLGFDDAGKGKGCGWWAKGKGKGKGMMPRGLSENCVDVAKRLEAAAGKPLCMRRMLKIIRCADRDIVVAEESLRQNREKREAKKAKRELKMQKKQLKEELKIQKKELKGACLDGTARLAEVFPEMPLMKVKWALAKAGGDVEVAAAKLSLWTELMQQKQEAMMCKIHALSQRLDEVGCPRGRERIQQLLKKTGGDVEAAVRIVMWRSGKGKGGFCKGKAWPQWAPWAASGTADDESSSSSSSESDSEV